MAGTVTASVIKNDTTSPPAFQNSAGTEIGTLCRAWVNFNGSAATIRTSFNVSSVTLNGTGDYTVTFTNAFADANYCAVFGAGSQAAGVGAYVTEQNDSVLRSTTQLRLYTTSNGTTLRTTSIVNMAVFR